MVAEPVIDASAVATNLNAAAATDTVVVPAAPAGTDTVVVPTAAVTTAQPATATVVV